MADTDMTGSDSWTAGEWKGHYQASGLSNRVLGLTDALIEKRVRGTRLNYTEEALYIQSASALVAAEIVAESGAKDSA